MVKKVKIQKPIYNLEFPSFCKKMEIHGYIFQRVPEYKERVKSLQHTISLFSEFEKPIATGTHAITAIVDLLFEEKSAVLPWGHDNPTALDDILLFLSIFTSRQVFALEPNDNGDSVIVADPREYFFGRSLKTSLPYERKKSDEGTEYDIGFEKGINKIYKKVRNKKWLESFGKGYFLFIFREACKRQILETSFILCWSIWEHLFALHNQKWLSDATIRKLPAKEKISFVVAKYKIKEQIESKDKKGLERLVQIRNKLIHTGRFPDEQSENGAELFVKITERVVAQILGLTPSDVLGSLPGFKALLSGEEKGFMREQLGQDV
jgi:hypothetical protein